MPITMLPILACIDRQLAICVGDVKMVTWLALVKLLPLIFDKTTPGMARKPTLAAAQIKVRLYPENHFLPLSYQLDHENPPI